MSCYHCGAYIQQGTGYRRWVRTGNSRRVYFGKKRISSSSGVQYGPRTLCRSCAEQHDELEKIKNIFIAVIVVGIVLFLIFAGHR